MTKEIPLTRGYVALVDDDDYGWVSKHVWHVSISKDGRLYAISGDKSSVDWPRNAKMHRMITGAAKGQEIDHVDGNGLNNCRSNLRIATRSQNASNRPAGRNNTSGYKGVHWDCINRKWRASLMVDRKCLNLGRYDEILDAVKAYNDAAKKYFGEFAVLNDVT